jgi:hypothetical protein
LIKHSVAFTPIDVSAIFKGDGVIKLLGVTAMINGSPIFIFNVYIPPSSSCPAQYKPDLTPLLSYSDSDMIILGDVNAHSGA